MILNTLFLHLIVAKTTLLVSISCTPITVVTTLSSGDSDSDSKNYDTGGGGERRSITTSITSISSSNYNSNNNPSQSQGSHTFSSSSNNNNSSNYSRPSNGTTTAKQYRRNRRIPPPTPPLSEGWLFPWGGEPSPPTPDSNSNSQFGLAYRSILPIRQSPHYTDLYRNRNIFSSGGEESGYNHNYYTTDEYRDKSSPKRKAEKVQIDDVKTTAESKTRSAPATESGGVRVSSTLEMGLNHGVASRDAIRNPSSYNRQPKLSKIVGEEDSSIVFPSGQGPSKRSRPRTVLATPPIITKSSQSPDEYMPPPLKTIDKAAWESLKLLLETRRKASGRTANAKYSPSSTRSRPAPPPATPLEIKEQPKCARENSGYCEQIETYPKEYLNDVLKNSLTLTPDVFQEVFGGDSADNKTVASDLAGRDGLNLMLDSPLCTSIEHTIYPKVAENREGKFMYIVNHDEYIQGVRVEKCVKEGGPCMHLEGSLIGYQSTCRQKYIYRKLLAFSRDGKATTDTFRLPSCCVCHVRSLFVDDRINNPFSSSSDAYTPAPVMKKNNAPVLTTYAEEESNSNSTIVDSATEMVHGDEDLSVPSPTDADIEVLLSNTHNDTLEEGVTLDPLAIGDRMMMWS